MRNGCILAVLSGLSAFADQQTVDRVFAEIRLGKFENTQILVRLGENAVPDIARYAADPETGVRSETIALLEQIGGDAACRAIEPSLNDSSADIRERAIVAFLHRCDHAQVPCEYLLAGLAKVQPSALAIVAAGYCAGDEAKPLLTKMLKGYVLVRVEAGEAQVPRSLAAAAGLLNAGDDVHLGRVISSLRSKVSVGEPEFLLRVLPDLPVAVAKEALPLLDDDRALGPPPKRRMQDAAVEALIAKLHLKVGFERSRFRRYTAEEIAQVRAAAAQVLN